MRIHHLNCGSMCPYGGWLFDGTTPGLGPARLCCHCLLIEAPGGLVLVDTGFGTADVTRPVPRLSRFFLALDRITLDRRDTALEQVAELGFHPGDVRHIVLTHLDFDHAGGIADFPHATVHVMAEEAAAARSRRGLLRRRRYRPAQFRAARSWREYAMPAGESWFGFASVRALTGLPPEILMVPLPGHSPGHAGVAVRTQGRWLLHAGDAVFHQGELADGPSPAPLALAYQWLMRTDRRAWRQNRERLRTLVHAQGDAVSVVCSHDFHDLLQRQREAETLKAGA
ncbi:MBL fold metallo-hydrolase [Rhodovastum atsumiense]|uniref:MBL fold metallo-hydrolase n=1 Tax=Rhodovastum atsumiense TaxID=504468 RepID=A0A5M6IN64_9PROT|nr:MBL fold metallo-hydrolase [Rhodovastum atsumiense]KAA5609703.1 MBL fold metallo-hydrolase [Rhodovastum atsumiense]